MVANRPKMGVAISDLDRLVTRLTVNLVSLAECIVSSGWRLSFPGGESPAMHYNLSGNGQIAVGSFPPIPLMPHTFVIVPAMIPFRIEGTSLGTRFKQVDIQQPSETTNDVARYVAGDGNGEVMMICGYLRATYGKSLDIFDNLSSPIVEQFDESDQLDRNMKIALAELVAPEVGMAAMTSSLVKEVLITILRRSLKSEERWVERFPVLSDARIARALADMVAEPAAPHSVQSLAHTAGLSRSGFMERFTRLVGVSPLAMLRQLRMKEAAGLLEMHQLSIEYVANAVGYTSRTSFSRAFRAVYGVDPSDYRTSEHNMSAGVSGKFESLDDGNS
jgi:AraC family transcriptional activator of mtrCDE